MKIYTVYDSKTEVYEKPFYAKLKGEVLREFSELCNDPQSKFCKYPADFTIFELGEYDESTASFNIYEAKLSLGLALDFKKEKTA